ncbi:MAG: 2Fe-2S iron-sulfur cluster binding domain-containing protein, partial [Ruminococcaceae bacterium]|nr:2Fe-2S iron-sulfur cluster binding domain-containing protein [Oscillospiraceae bacterium]
MFIRVIDENESIDITAEPGVDLMTLLRQQKKSVSSPCGGRGTCGKCLVEVDGLGPVLAC